MWEKEDVSLKYQSISVSNTWRGLDDYRGPNPSNESLSGAVDLF